MLSKEEKGCMARPMLCRMLHYKLHTYLPVSYRQFKLAR